MSKFSDSLQSQLSAVRVVKPQEEESLSAKSNMEVVDLNYDGRTKSPNRLEDDLGLREKTSIERFEENPCERTLRNISKLDQTPKMVKVAVEADGTALKSVSKKLLTYELCKVAVAQNGMAIKYVPEQMLTDEIVQIAVENNGLVLYHIEGRITKQLAILAVRQSMKLKRNDFFDYPIAYVPEELIDEALIADSISYSPCSLKNTPTKYKTKEIVLQAVTKDGAALEYVPANKINKQLIELAVNSNPSNLQFVPLARRTQEICEVAFQNNPFTLRWIPEKYITSEMCLTVIEASDDSDRDKNFDISWFPDIFRNDKAIIDALIKKIGSAAILEWNTRLLEKRAQQDPAAVLIKPLSKSVVTHIQKIIDVKRSAPIRKLELVEVETSPSASDALLVPIEQTTATSYDLMLSDDVPSKTVYYISDLHIEHQLKDILEKENCTSEDVSIALDQKITEMVSSVNDPSGYLLIAGDVGHYKSVVALFYQKLRRRWNGTIISVLGNHELWDDHPKSALSGYISRPISEIVSDYRNIINFKGWLNSGSLLQNAVYINYKNKRDCIIEEEKILSASEMDLHDICSKASLVVLGGIGFSGLNERFNATRGLYSAAVTTLREDEEQSERFASVYDKMLRCASEIQVIVLTHTSVSDWLSVDVNPNWIYINGHTHHNSLIRKSNGTTILSDNQVGYTPTKWKLNSFSVAGWYDPFKDMDNGIHEITSDDYMDFNRGRGIHSNGCKYPGKIYVLKKNELYMFVIQSASSLCLLVGGQRKKLSRYDIQYYYDNMERYSQKVTEAVAPFQQALSVISEEVHRFGGWGKIHGCIVDIDFFNHIYLNPFDGTLTPYHAWNIQYKLVFDDMISLLKEHLPELCESYEAAKENELLPMLSRSDGKGKKSKKKMVVAKVPQLVLETDMYNPSRIMKSIQYIFENNVIRIWNDDILSADFSDNTIALDMNREIKIFDRK
ncbi:MAG: hypothetical protein NC177_15190 [Ruminococcus flavefaciens]|nr:hypothetical protein [Ruminococcus flavefaciens]